MKTKQESFGCEQYWCVPIFQYHFRHNLKAQITNLAIPIRYYKKNKWFKGYCFLDIVRKNEEANELMS